MNTRIRSAILLTLFGLGAYSQAVMATDIEMTLEGDQVVPPVASRAKGTGTIVVENDGTISGSIQTTGIEGTEAHIHVGAQGENGQRIITLTKIGNTYAVPPGSRLTDAQMELLAFEELYVNVLSAEHPSGEIRAQFEQ